MWNPLAKLGNPELRSLLEENGYSLTDPRHMMDLVPFILDEERKLIRKHVEDKFLSVIFDGTTRQGEVLAVVVRFIQNWKVEQRLVQKSVSGEELARELISTLSVMLGIKSGMLVGAMHNCASVNSVAMHTVCIMYPSVLDIGCMSHAFDCVGKISIHPILTHFLTSGSPCLHIAKVQRLCGKKEPIEQWLPTPKLSGGVGGK